MTDILQVCRALRPGTAWNYDGTALTQADDGTPRVAVPLQAEIDAYVAAHPAPSVLPDLQSQIIALAQGGQALANLKQALQGKNPVGL